MQRDPRKIKLAILFVGEYRTFGYCRRSMKFLDWEDKSADIYFSTWNQTAIQNPVQHVANVTYEKRHVTENEIRKSIGKGYNLKIRIHDINDMVPGKPPLLQSWTKGIEFVVEQNINYDYILVLRPDLFFDNEHFDNSATFDFSNLDKYRQGLGVQPPGLDNGTDDTLFFSTYRNMRRLLSHEVFKTSTSKGWHVNWYEYIRLQGLTLTDVPLTTRYNIARFPMTKRDNFNSVLGKWQRWQLNQIEDTTKISQAERKELKRKRKEKLRNFLTKPK